MANSNWTALKVDTDIGSHGACMESVKDSGFASCEDKSLESSVYAFNLSTQVGKPKNNSQTNEDRNNFIDTSSEGCIENNNQRDLGESDLITYTIGHNENDNKNTGEPSKIDIDVDSKSPSTGHIDAMSASQLQDGNGENVTKGHDSSLHGQANPVNETNIPWPDNDKLFSCYGSKMINEEFFNCLCPDGFISNTVAQTSLSQWDKSRNENMQESDTPDPSTFSLRRYGHDLRNAFDFGKSSDMDTRYEECGTDEDSCKSTRMGKPIGVPCCHSTPNEDSNVGDQIFYSSTDVTDPTCDVQLGDAYQATEIFSLESLNQDKSNIEIIPACKYKNSEPQQDLNTLHSTFTNTNMDHNKAIDDELNASSAEYADRHNQTVKKSSRDPEIVGKPRKCSWDYEDLNISTLFTETRGSPTDGVKCDLGKQIIQSSGYVESPKSFLQLVNIESNSEALTLSIKAIQQNDQCKPDSRAKSISSESQNTVNLIYTNSTNGTLDPSPTIDAGTATTEDEDVMSLSGHSCKHVDNHDKQNLVELGGTSESDDEYQDCCSDLMDSHMSLLVSKATEVTSGKPSDNTESGFCGRKFQGSGDFYNRGHNNSFNLAAMNVNQDYADCKCIEQDKGEESLTSEIEKKSECELRHRTGNRDFHKQSKSVASRIEEKDLSHSSYWAIASECLHAVESCEKIEEATEKAMDTHNAVSYKYGDSETKGNVTIDTEKQVNESNDTCGIVTSIAFSTPVSYTDAVMSDSHEKISEILSIPGNGVSHDESEDIDKKSSLSKESETLSKSQCCESETEMQRDMTAEGNRSAEESLEDQKDTSANKHCANQNDSGKRNFGGLEDMNLTSQEFTAAKNVDVELDEEDDDCGSEEVFLDACDLPHTAVSVNNAKSSEIPTSNNEVTETTSNSDTAISTRDNFSTQNLSESTEEDIISVASGDIEVENIDEVVTFTANTNSPKTRDSATQVPELKVDSIVKTMIDSIQHFKEGIISCKLNVTNSCDSHEPDEHDEKNSKCQEDLNSFTNSKSNYPFKRSSLTLPQARGTRRGRIRISDGAEQNMTSSSSVGGCNVRPNGLMPDPSNAATCASALQSRSWRKRITAKNVSSRCTKIPERSLPSCENIKMDCRQKSQAAASKFIGEYLHELWKNECLCDVRIKAGTQSFLAHKIVLAAFSDVFCPSEPMPNPTLLVDVPNTSTQAVYQILQYLYTSEMEITDESMEDILSAALFLGVTDVVDLIKEILANPTKETVVQYLNIADRMQMNINLKDTPRLFRQYLQEIWDSQPFKLMSDDNMIRLLCDQQILVEHETEIIVALSKWVEGDMKDRIPKVPGLLRYINYVCIPPAELANVVNRYPHIYNNKECQTIIAEVYKSFAMNESVPDKNNALNESANQTHHQSPLDKRHSREEAMKRVTTQSHGGQNGEHHAAPHHRASSLPPPPPTGRRHCGDVSDTLETICNQFRSACHTKSSRADMHHDRMRHGGLDDLDMEHSPERRQSDKSLRTNPSNISHIGRAAHRSNHHNGPSDDHPSRPPRYTINPESDHHTDPHSGHHKSGAIHHHAHRSDHHSGPHATHHTDIYGHQIDHRSDRGNHHNDHHADRQSERGHHTDHHKDHHKDHHNDHNADRHSDRSHYTDHHKDHHKDHHADRHSDRGHHTDHHKDHHNDHHADRHSDRGHHTDHHKEHHSVHHADRLSDRSHHTDHHSDRSHHTDRHSDRGRHTDHHSDNPRAKSHHALSQSKASLAPSKAPSRFTSHESVSNSGSGSLVEDEAESWSKGPCGYRPRSPCRPRACSAPRSCMPCPSPRACCPRPMFCSDMSKKLSSCSFDSVSRKYGLRSLSASRGCSPCCGPTLPRACSLRTKSCLGNMPCLSSSTRCGVMDFGTCMSQNNDATPPQTRKNIIKDRSPIAKLGSTTTQTLESQLKKVRNFRMSLNKDNSSEPFHANLSSKRSNYDNLSSPKKTREECPVVPRKGR